MKCSRFGCGAGKREINIKNILTGSKDKQKNNCLDEDTRELKNPVNIKFCGQFGCVSVNRGLFSTDKTMKKHRLYSNNNNLKAKLLPLPAWYQSIRRQPQLKYPFVGNDKTSKHAQNFKKRTSKQRFADVIKCTRYACTNTVHQHLPTGGL